MVETNAEALADMKRWIRLVKIACNRVDVINQLLPSDAAICERARSGGVDLCIGGRVLFSYRNWDCPGMEKLLVKLETVLDFVWLIDPYL